MGRAAPFTALVACGFVASCGRSPAADAVDDAGIPDTGTVRNACGGGGELEFDGAPATPGASCGPCMDGALVCGTPNQLVCVGASGALRCRDSGSPNACSGMGALSYAGQPASPGDACGPCRDGTLICAGIDALTCIGSRPRSDCPDASMDAGVLDGGADSTADAQSDSAAEAGPPACVIPASAYTAAAPTVPKPAPETAPVSDSDKVLSLLANDVAYSPFDQLLYASVPSAQGIGGNTIAVIDPLAASVLGTYYVGSEPDALALSDDGKVLWVALDGAGTVRRFDTATRTAGMQFSLPPNKKTSELAVVPGTETSVLVNYFDTTSGPWSTVAVYDDGVSRPYALGQGPGNYSRVVMTYAPSLIYSWGSSSPRQCLNASGLFPDTTQPHSFSTGGGPPFSFAHGVIYEGDGAYEIASDSRVSPSSAAASGPVTADFATNRVFYMPAPYGSSAEIVAYDMTTFMQTGATGLYAPGSPNRLVRWGRYGFAVSAPGSNLSIVRSSIVPVQP